MVSGAHSAGFQPLSQLNGFEVQTGLSTTASGSTYTLPRIVNTVNSLVVPNGVNVEPASGGSFVYGSVNVVTAPLASTDPNYLTVPSASRAACQVVDLAAQNISGPLWPLFTSMTGGNTSCDISIPRLFCDDAPMSFARYPSTPLTYSLMTGTPGSNYFFDSSLPLFLSNSVFAQAYIVSEYTDFYAPAMLADAGGGTTKVTWSATPPATIEAQSRYWLFNVLDELLSPGQFFIDLQLWRIYFIPKDSNPHHYRVSVCNQDLLVFSGGSTAATIGSSGTDQICLRHGNASGINMYGPVANQTLQNVQISGCGQLGAQLGFASTGWTINNLFCQYCGSNGLLLGGGGGSGIHSLDPSNHLVTNLYLDSNCQQCRSSAGQLRVTAIGADITGTITNSVNQALQAQSTRNTTFNLFIDSACNEAGDVGSVYCGQDPCMFGNILDNIVVKNIPVRFTSAKGVATDRRAIYLDDCAGGWTITSPLCADCLGGSAIFTNGGRANSITDPTYINCNNLTPFGMTEAGSPYATNAPFEYDRWLYPGVMTSISGFSVAAGVVTLTLPMYHGYQTGLNVDVAGVTGSGLVGINGNWTLTSTTATSASYSSLGAAGTYASGGTIAVHTNGPYYQIWSDANTSGAYTGFGAPFSTMTSNFLGTPQDVSYTGTVTLYSDCTAQDNYQTAFTDAPVTMATPNPPNGTSPSPPSTPAQPFQPSPY